VRSGVPLAVAGLIITGPPNLVVAGDAIARRLRVGPI
jgi:hypothetical protein